jgi:cell wall-associated protease
LDEGDVEMMRNVLILLLLIGTLQIVKAESDSISDLLFPKQWGLFNHGQEIRRSSGELTRNYVLGIPGMDINWDRMEGRNIDSNNEIIVAVIDSGLDIGHPELKGRVWEDPECLELSEEDRAKFPCHGMNFLAKSNAQKINLKDTTGHGTHVSGIIAANINQEGVAGVAVKNVKIMPIKVLSKETTSFVYEKKLITDIIADAIGFAVLKKAHIINLSLGWPKIIETPRMRSALKLAEKEGVLIVAAAGNNNKNVPTYPCTNRGIICVGAVDNVGKLSEFSNHGGKVDILAPGESIISLFPQSLESRTLRIGGYELKKGTSQASPFVAAIAASVKLVHPEISLDELKARILNSARPLKTKLLISEKHSKYGLIDMKKAIDVKPEHFVSPDFKSLLEIGFNSNGETGFNIPVKSFVSNIENLKIKITTDSKAFQIIESDFELNILKGETKNLFIQAKLIDGTQDSSAHIKVELSVGEKVLHQSQTLLMLTSSFLKKENLVTVPLNDIEPRMISYFKGSRKVARMKYIFDKFNKFNGQEFYYVNKSIQTEKETILTALQIKDGVYSQVNLTIPKAGQLLSIFKVDVNLDGNMDYFIYTMDEKRENLIFSLRNENGEKLFKKDNSDWTFVIGTFEGLPLKNEFEADFSWIKTNSKEFGTILVPAISKIWNLPDADNTDDILDRLPNSKELRLYYLVPKTKKDKTIINVRTVLNFNFSEKISKKFNLLPSESFSVQTPFMQTESEEANGSIRSILAVGREFRKRYYLITFTDTKKYTLNSMKVDKSYLEGNSVFPLNNLTPKNNPGDEATYMVLSNRVEARLSVVSNQGEVSRVERKNDSWGDPFFSYIGAFKQKTKNLFFLESRYNVYALDSNGGVKTLPVNRDSSFPGSKFAETMDQAAVFHKGEIHPAVFVNSTNVFGNRVYLMVDDGKVFKRPVNTSLNIPRNCIDLKPGRHGEKGYHFQFLCKESNGRVSIKLLPFEY